MPFTPKKTQKKVDACYKSLYLHQDLVDEVDQIAKEHNTSFNNVVVSMIEQCLAEIQKEKQE